MDSGMSHVHMYFNWVSKKKEKKSYDPTEGRLLEYVLQK